MKLIILIFFMGISLYGVEPIVEKANQLQLTENEKKWLAEHHTIKVGLDPDYAPYEWINEDGEFIGAAVDYMHVLEKMLGLNFELIKNKSWTELLAMAKNAELDMLTSIVKTPERSKYITFSEAYRDTPTIIIDNGKGSFIGSLKQLSNKKVSVEKGYFMEEFMKKNYPDIIIVTTVSTKEALNMVYNDKVDAYVGDANIADYTIKINDFDTLRFSGQTEYISHQSFGFTKGNEILAQILTKAMKMIPKEESDAMFNGWLNIESGIKPQTIIKYAFIIAIIMMFFIYRNRVLKKYNDSLEDAQIKLMNEAKEKEILYQELNHRVKNNLQIISSIISLHSSKKDTSQALEDINNTISAISIAHNKLYHSENNNMIEIKHYINDLLENIFSSSILQIQKEVNSPEIYLDAQHSITLGIIINEFISNSIKYAFHGINRPKISITIIKSKEFLNITISDNGIGFKEEKQSSGLGINIIKSLTKSKFKTDAVFYQDNGTSIALKIHY